MENLNYRFDGLTQIFLLEDKFKGKSLEGMRIYYDNDDREILIVGGKVWYYRRAKNHRFVLIEEE